MIQEIRTAAAPAAIGPYSQGMAANGLIFFSGQIPIDPQTGAIVRGTAAEQAERVIRNLSALLAAAGTDFAHVVKTTCFLTSMADFDEFNAVYAKYFTGKPARSCVAVAALPKGVSVEIEAVAVKPDAV
jgi:2-iminobutanoate/2-iminopropanoate deaminase